MEIYAIILKENSEHTADESNRAAAAAKPTVHFKVICAICAE